MVYYIIACRKDGADEGQVELTIRQKVLPARAQGQTMGGLYSLTAGVDKNSFKCGSLDELMSLNDQFQKFEMTIDGSCKRIEKVASDLFNEIQGRAEPAANNQAAPKFELKITQSVGVEREAVHIPVEEYLKNFQWDSGIYLSKNTLGENGALCLKNQKSGDEQVKMQ